MAFYTPNSIATRPVTGTDSPYVIPIGVVTTYDPVLSGALTLQFPASPVDGSIVTVKNATADPSPVTLDPNGNTFEAPDTSDTAYLTTGTVSHSAPKQSYRWIFDGTDTWWIDHSYKPQEDRTVPVTANYTLKRPGEICIVDFTTALADITLTVPAGWPDDSQFGVIHASDHPHNVIVASAGAETFSKLFTAGPPQANVILASQNDCVTYIKNGDTWWARSKDLSDYVEMWIIAADTSVPETTPANVILTHGLNSVGTASSSLFSGSGTNVLTALGDRSLVVDIQANVWIHLTANNSNIQTRLSPISNAANQIVNRLWTSAGSSRIESFPSSVYGSFLIDFLTGNTFSVEAVFNAASGSALVELGDSAAGDTRGGLVVFST